MKPARLADQGVDGLLSPITVGSPAFVRILTLWLSVVGISPVSGLLMNLCLYVAACALFVWLYDPSDDWRQDLPLVFGLCALSFAPALIIHSSQSLKDELFVFLIIAACASSIGLFRPLVEGATTSRWKTQMAAVVFLACSVDVDCRHSTLFCRDDMVLPRRGIPGISRRASIEIGPCDWRSDSDADCRLERILDRSREFVLEPRSTEFNRSRANVARSWR